MTDNLTSPKVIFLIQPIDVAMLFESQWESQCES